MNFQTFYSAAPIITQQNPVKHSVLDEKLEDDKKTIASLFSDIDNLERNLSQDQKDKYAPIIASKKDEFAQVKDDQSSKALLDSLRTGLYRELRNAIQTGKALVTPKPVEKSSQTFADYDAKQDVKQNALANAKPKLTGISALAAKIAAGKAPAEDVPNTPAVAPTVAPKADVVKQQTTPEQRLEIKLATWEAQKQDDPEEYAAFKATYDAYKADPTQQNLAAALNT